MIRKRKLAGTNKKTIATARRILAENKPVISMTWIRRSGAAYRDSDEEPLVSVPEASQILAHEGTILRASKGSVLLSDGRNTHICRDVKGLRKAGLIL